MIILMGGLIKLGIKILKNPELNFGSARFGSDWYASDRLDLIGTIRSLRIQSDQIGLDRIPTTRKVWMERYTGQITVVSQSQDLSTTRPESETRVDRTRRFVERVSPRKVKPGTGKTREQIFQDSIMTQESSLVKIP